MWISNTATAVMILPVGIAVVLQLQDNPNTIENENSIFQALMLALHIAPQSVVYKFNWYTQILY